MKKIIALIFIVSYSLLVAQTEIPRSKDITDEEIIYHIKHLSSDQFQGRRTGTEFCDSAGAYIEREFQRYGLKAFNGNYRQTYEVLYGLELGKNNSLKINGVKTKLEINKNYIPLSFSSSEKCKGEMVFVGYGISLSDSDYNYNDYSNVDVKDKIVLIMLGIPEDSTSNKFMRFDNPRYKASIARDKGAKAIIFFDPDATTEEKELPKLRAERTSNSGLPIVQIRKSVAEELFKSIGKNLSDEINKINNKGLPQSFVSKKTIIDLSTDINEIRKNTFNVIGFIEGYNPSLKDEYIVIGAHYDHLGLGGAGSLEPNVTQTHPGADDNASGTAGVLELAQYFSNYSDIIGRSIIFMAFSGEEEGLLGSAHYIKFPLVPLEKTTLMINMDMIGRMRDNKLIINGAGSSSKFHPIINKYNIDSILLLKLNDDGFSPSDNSSFYGKDIPIMMFFTDLHLDYHKTSDSWEKINVEGQNKILNFIKNITIDLSNENEKIDFIKPQASSTSTQGMTSFRVSTGIIPDFSEQAEGVKIQGTREGSPANKAGLISGDVIIKFGERTIKNLYDYTYALGEHRSGERVTVIWMRNGQEMIGVLELVKR
jgi:hypothetical protein